MNRLITFALVILIGGGLALYKAKSNHDVDDKVDATVEKVLAACKRTAGYAKYEARVIESGEVAHDRAMDVAYTPSSRRGPAKFDARKYALTFAEQIVIHGKLGQTDRDLDQFLRQLQIDLEHAANAGEFD